MKESIATSPVQSERFRAALAGRDYALIAAIIRELPGPRFVMADRVAAALASEDPQFDYEAFLTAALPGVHRSASKR